MRTIYGKTDGNVTVFIDNKEFINESVRVGY